MTVDYQTLVYDPIFDIFGRAASYRPPTGGESVACTVIRDKRDVNAVDFNIGQPLLQGDLIKVRASELAEPKKGGTFTIDSETVEIADDPRCEESERLVWTMTVRAAS